MIFPLKYKNLVQAKKNDLLVPATLFLGEESFEQKKYSKLLSDFLHNFSIEQRWIIRSCICGEDGTKNSLAGHFISSEALSTEKLTQNIEILFAANKTRQIKLCPNGSTNLMIQEFIEPKIGGVVFSPWQYFCDYFYAEWGNSPQDVVTGKISGQALMRFQSLRPSAYRSNNCVQVGDTAKQVLTDSQKQKLKTMVEKLTNVFKFSLDAEWVIDNNDQLYVLQVRPVTRPIGALALANQKQIIEQKNCLNAIAPGEWRINGLAESLGVLSPESFALWENLYQGSRHWFQTFGWKATLPFLARANNGQTYIHSARYKNYFRPRNFWQNILIHSREPQWKRKIIQFCHNETNQTQAGSRDSLSKKNRSAGMARLKDIFQYWVIANFYASKKNLQNFSFYGSAGEYELLSYAKVYSPDWQEPDNWNDLRIFLKKLFLYVSVNLYKKAQSDKINDSESQIRNATLAYPSQFGGADSTHEKALCIAGQKIVTAPIQRILNPATFRLSLKKYHILVAPYFDNRWILDLPDLAGVILEKGGQLSHSALVAREKNIPYFVEVDDALQKFKDKKEVTLDCLQKKIY